jgi:hypothetical protein
MMQLSRGAPKSTFVGNVWVDGNGAKDSPTETRRAMSKAEAAYMFMVAFVVIWDDKLDTISLLEE